MPCSCSFYFLQFWLGFDDGLGSHGLSCRRSGRIQLCLHHHIYLFSSRIRISLSPSQHTHLLVFPSSFLHFSFFTATHSPSGISFYLFLFLSLLCFWVSFLCLPVYLYSNPLYYSIFLLYLSFHSFIENQLGNDPCVYTGYRLVINKALFSYNNKKKRNKKHK